MLGEQALTAAVAALFAVQLIAFLVAVRGRRDTLAANGNGLVEDPGTPVHEEAVECRHCGERNDRGYRFCRRCVRELPGQVSYGGGSATPATRNTL